MLHPTIVKSTFSLFECQRIEDDVYKMKAHLDFDCYSPDHITWIMVIAMPSLIIWVIGVPLFAFIVLSINRHSLDSGPVKKIFLVLYQGLKQKAFYWEFVNTIRKVLLLLFSAVLSIFPLTYSALVSISTLVVLIYIQIKIDPYEDKKHNHIEIKAVIAGTMTLFCGIIFDQKSSEDGTPTIIMTIMVFLVITNLMFIIEWLYLFIKTFNIKNAKVQLLLQVLASLILERHELDIIYESRSSHKSEQDDDKSKEIHVSMDPKDKPIEHRSHLDDKLSMHSNYHCQFLVIFDTS